MPRSPIPTASAGALRADSWWGIAALLWLATGLPRLLAGLEKPTAYYLGNHLFWVKMGLFGLILLLELGPMVGLIQWRIALAKGQAPNLAHARRYARISRAQTALLLVLVFVATAIARGYGLKG